MDEHPPFHAVKGVLALPPHHLLLEFDAGEYRVVDLGKLAGRTEPLFAPLSEWETFRQVRVDEDGITVVWPNGLDLDPGMLYASGIPIDVGQILSNGSGNLETKSGTWANDLVSA